jgi:hypothetical protein
MISKIAVLLDYILFRIPPKIPATRSPEYFLTKNSKI